MLPEFSLIVISDSIFMMINDDTQLSDTVERIATSWCIASRETTFNRLLSQLVRSCWPSRSYSGCCDICCVPLKSWTRDDEFTSGETAFHSRRKLVITSGELELGSCTSSSPLVIRWRRFMMCMVTVNRSFYLFCSILIRYISYLTIWGRRGLYCVSAFHSQVVNSWLPSCDHEFTSSMKCSNRHAFLFLWPWPWPDDLVIRTWCMKMYLHTRMNFLGQGFQKLKHHRQTHRHTDRCDRMHYYAAIHRC